MDDSVADSKLINKNGYLCETRNIDPEIMDAAENERRNSDSRDVKCGFTCFHPKWLQIFASKKAFVIVYSIAGMQQFILGTYHIGIMSTMEKAYNMSSFQSGLITAAWDLGSFFASILITYVAAKGHRTRWVAVGTFFLGVASLIRMLPYYMYGGGEMIKMYTKEYNSTDFLEMGNGTGLKKLSTNVMCEKNSNDGNAATFYISVASQMIVGMGSAVYWTCGAAYLDDNVRKNIVPALLAIVQFIRLFGPTVGFLLSSYALKIYVEPSLTPFINHEDPRWIGAWWLGWYPLAFSAFMMAFLLYLFPRSLPRTVIRKRKQTVQRPTTSGVSMADFKQALMRIRKNKIIVYNSMSTVCFTVAMMAFWTFMPKYMESQFRLSPSKSNFLTGTVSILCNAIGVMAAGLIISKVRPSPRYLAGWNVFVEILDFVGHIMYSFLGCPPLEYHGHWDADRSWNLTETCNANLGCGTDIQFSPVCDPQTNLTYYSWCHAGCNATRITEGITEYTGCLCAPNSRVVNGACPADCSTSIFIFILIWGTLSFTSATGRSANTLIQFRSVEERDKSLSIGVTEALLSLFAFLPSPIIYGIIMDWTCIVWGDDCGKKGNCWLYDNQRLRLVFNLSAGGFLFLGTILDCFVWYYVKELKLYEEDFKNEVDEKCKPRTPIVRIRNSETEYITLPDVHSAALDESNIMQQHQRGPE